MNSVSKDDVATNSRSPTAEKVPGIKRSFFDDGTVTVIKGKNFANVQYTRTSADPPRSQ